MSVKFKGKTRRVYGKPMSKYAGNGAGFDIPNEVMEEIAKVMLDFVKREANIEIAKHVNKPTRDGGGDVPAYIRDTKAFLAMLKARVSGKSSIEIYVSEGKRKKKVGDRVFTVHPYHSRFVSDDPKDHKPFPMDSLKSKVGKTIPLVELDGKVVFRVVLPNSKWVHPGFLKYNFLERGIEKGREKAIDIIREKVVVPLIVTSDFFS
jgi:hypothetical protein